MDASGPLTGTHNGAAWALKSSEVTAGGATVLLYRNGAAPGVAYFKPISLINKSLTSYTPRFTTVAGSVLAQATATAQPWVSSDGLGIRYQQDYLQWSAAASAMACMHNGAGGTIIWAVRPSAFPAAQSHCMSTVTTLTPAAGVIGFTAWYNATTVGMYVFNGGGTPDVGASAASPVAAGTTYVFALRVAAGANGVSLWQNSVQKVTATLTAPSAADPQSALRLGTYGGSFAVDGILGHPAVYNRALTDAEIIQASNYILAQATL
jgi:hypothetical protein